MFDTIAPSRLNRRPPPKYRAVLDQARGAGGGLSDFAWTGWDSWLGRRAAQEQR
jgi:hypothetical protein